MVQTATTLSETHVQMPRHLTFPEEGSARPGVGKVGGTGEKWSDKGNCLRKGLLKLMFQVFFIDMLNYAQFSPYNSITNSQ